MLVVLQGSKGSDSLEAAGRSGVVEQLRALATTDKVPDNGMVIVSIRAIIGVSNTDLSTEEVPRVNQLSGAGYGNDFGGPSTSRRMSLPVASVCGEIRSWGSAHRNLRAVSRPSAWVL